MKTKSEFMAEAMEIRSRLFDIANAFSGDETGTVAVLLHGACNEILWANERFGDNVAQDPVPV